MFQIASMYWQASALEVYQSGGLIQSFEIKVVITLKMEAAGPSEVLVTTLTVAWCHIPENHSPNFSAVEISNFRSIA